MDKDNKKNKKEPTAQELMKQLKDQAKAANQEEEQ